MEVFFHDLIYFQNSSSLVNLNDEKSVLDIAAKWSKRIITFCRPFKSMSDFSENYHN